MQLFFTYPHVPRQPLHGLHRAGVGVVHVGLGAPVEERDVVLLEVETVLLGVQEGVVVPGGLAAAEPGSENSSTDYFCQIKSEQHVQKNFSDIHREHMHYRKAQILFFQSPIFQI